MKNIYKSASAFQPKDGTKFIWLEDQYLQGKRVESASLETQKIGETTPKELVEGEFKAFHNDEIKKYFLTLTSGEDEVNALKRLVLKTTNRNGYSEDLAKQWLEIFYLLGDKEQKVLFENFEQYMSIHHGHASKIIEGIRENNEAIIEAELFNPGNEEDQPEELANICELFFDRTFVTKEEWSNWVENEIFKIKKELLQNDDAFKDLHEVVQQKMAIDELQKQTFPKNYEKARGLLEDCFLVNLGEWDYVYASQALMKSTSKDIEKGIEIKEKYDKINSEILKRDSL